MRKQTKTALKNKFYVGGGVKPSRGIFQNTLPTRNNRHETESVARATSAQDSGAGGKKKKKKSNSEIWQGKKSGRTHWGSKM